MTSWSFVVLAALRLILAGYVAGAAPSRARGHAPPRDWSALQRATITANPKRAELVIELPAVDLPAGAMVDQPASVGELPVSGAVYALHAEVVDAHGRQLPIELLHHVNVMDPNERELFLPISRRILASGTETGEIRFPWFLVGAPIRAGQLILSNAMLHNATTLRYHDVRARLVVSYVPERRPWPLFTVIPWQLDVAFPVGDKSFDLPPGRTERAYEGSPSVDGKLIVIGGHMHQYGRTIEFWDATTGELLWHGEPVAAQTDQPNAVPVTKLYSLMAIGLRITPSHRYRVRVIYENPTGHTIAGGGMGVVGGLFAPDRKASWPKTDAGDSLYQKDLRHFMGPVGSSGAMPPMHIGH
ncbi:MAG: hypothetical protein DMD48_00945 [Gemmatimonadetes bacterium]|nr:MAG: hypothetical protein DMD48_00945 [Gemmatimonadota bacterium]